MGDLMRVGDIVGTAKPIVVSDEANEVLERRRLRVITDAERKRDERDYPGWLFAAGAPGAPRVVEADVPSAVRSWARSWRMTPSGCALLSGPTGTGKSMAVQWLIGSLWKRGAWDDQDLPRDWRPLGTARRIRAVDLQRSVYNGRIEERQTWESLSLLAIEDVRVLPESAWRLADELHALVDLRCDAGRATVITTNVDPGSFEAAYEPLFSRLVGESGGPGLVVMAGADRRRAEARS